MYKCQWFDAPVQVVVVKVAADTDNHSAVVDASFVYAQHISYTDIKLFLHSLVYNRHRSFLYVVTVESSPRYNINAHRFYEIVIYVHKVELILSFLLVGMIVECGLNESVVISETRVHKCYLFYLFAIFESVIYSR